MLLAVAKAASHSNSEIWLILIVVAYIAFYFLFIRPRVRRQKSLRTQSRAVEIGDKVQTIGGLVGVVVEMDDHVVTLRTKDGYDLEFLRAAIAQQYQEPVTAVEAEPSDETESEGDAN